MNIWRIISNRRTFLHFSSYVHLRVCSHYEALTDTALMGAGSRYARSACSSRIVFRETTNRKLQSAKAAKATLGLSWTLVWSHSIWMRIRGKNQNSLITFVGLQCNVHRIAVDVHRSDSQIRFARSHVRYVRSFAGHVYTFTGHVRTQRSNVRNNNYFYVYPLYVAFCIRFGLTQFR